MAMSLGYGDRDRSHEGPHPMMDQEPRKCDTE
jgi:hypothetical protein